MNHPVRRVTTSVMAAAVLVLGVSGCSSSVDKGDIQKAVKSKLTQSMAGHKVGAVTCDKDLDAKVGASTKCSVSIDGHKRAFSAVVTKVDGSKVHYSIKTPKS